MRLKVTIGFREGKNVTAMVNVPDSRKGADKKVHYQLEASRIAESIVNNGIQLTIQPTEIGQVSVRGIEGGSDGNLEFGKAVVKQGMQGDRLHSVPQGGAV